ncbi:MAG: hypothetical protein SVW77_01535 [Candidatus Nanohaloarchaea archaeon]|nr:hypothetical protein [Candidatus Nanohaloarchaea archaeon]
MGIDRTASLLLVSAVLLAGCTTVPQTTDDEDRQIAGTTPNDGLSIRFDPVTPTFVENEVLAFDTAISNTGGNEATINSISMAGGPFLQEGGGVCDRVEDRLQVSGSFPAGMTVQEAVRCAPPLSSSHGANQANLPDGATDTFPARLVVEYGYTTTATTSVVLANPSRFTSSSPVTTENSDAPVHARVALQSPQSIRDTGQLDIPVTIRNVGDGEVAGPVQYRIFVAGDQKVQGQTTLVDGQRQIVESVGGFGTGDVPERQFRIRIELSYPYRETATSQFTVEGQPEQVTVESREDFLPGDTPPPGDGTQPGDQPSPGAKTFHVEIASSTSKQYEIKIKKQSSGNGLRAVFGATGDALSFPACTPQSEVSVDGSNPQTVPAGALYTDIPGSTSSSEVSVDGFRCPGASAEFDCVPVTHSGGLDLPLRLQTTCFKGPVTYEAWVAEGGSTVQATIQQGGRSQTAASPFTFEANGFGNSIGIGDTVTITASADGCQGSLSITAGTDSHTTGLTCDGDDG